MYQWISTGLIPAAVICLPLAVHAQENADKDKVTKEIEDQKKTIQAQKDLINAQKDLIDAEKGLLQSKLPTLPAGKAGTITFDSGNGDVLHATAQSYKALGNAAKQLCVIVKERSETDEENQPVAIVTADDLRLAAQYRIVKQEADQLEKAFDKALKVDETTKTSLTPAAPAGAVAGMALTTLIDISKLFRTDKKLAFSAPTIDESDLTDQIARCLANTEGVTKKHPIAAPPLPGGARYARVETANVIAFGTSHFLAQLDGLASSNAVLATKIRQLQDDISAAEKKSAKTKGQSAGAGKPADLDKTDLEDKKRELAVWQALAARYGAFKVSLDGSDAATRLAIALAALQGEAVAKMLEAPGTKLLTTRIAAKGGTTLVTSSAIRSDRMYSSGGVVITYRLTDGNSVQEAGSIQVDSRLEEIQKLSADRPPKTGRP